MQNETNKFIIDVVPIARLPLSRQQYFSYLFEREIGPGALVSVPLFRREIQGIVVGCRPDFEHVGGYELKNVYRILQENFLTDGQLKLAEQISNYYLTSLGVVLKHFMPKRVHGRSIQNTTNSTQKKLDITLTVEQSHAVDAIVEAKKLMPEKLKSYLLHGPASSGKTEVYIHSIIKLKLENPEQQFLILLPELTLAPQAIERYGVYFNQDEIVLLHSKLPKGQFYSNWQDIQSGKAKIIIATRIGIFAPFKKLGLIVIDEEQDMSYKQWDMNPRYDARQGAEFLSENFSCPIVFGSSTPRIESFYKSQSKKYELIELPVLIIPNTKYVIRNTKYELVDMRKEKWTDYNGKKKANFSFLSTRLQEEISYALSNKLQTILFVNHQGSSTFSVCSSCKAVLKCEKCDRALIYDESGVYKCLHCNFVTDPIPSCKSCGSIVFENIGIGTQSVVREIKKMFPRARTCRLDTAAIKKPGAQEEVFNLFSKNETDILVGTQMITKGWDNPNVGLVGIIDADSLFSAPDYLTDERAYCNIMQIAGRTGRVGAIYPGYVIIQTFNPQNPVFDFIIKRDYSAFYKKEITQRESLRYPPFGKITKLTFQDADNAKVEKEIRKIYTALNKLIINFTTLRLTEPSKPIVSKVRGKFRMHILLKNFEAETPLPKEIVKVISSLSSGWSVDVDPISIA